ncbi:MAG TPA: FadR/GntR family transcriptional regulator [Steroidobacteraceae bacterium]|nr:FadR/GntR family transcriptional regulator [Steroidobacteraceae bacterium]
MPEFRRLYERIAHQIATDIRAGKYLVGQRLPSERELAQVLKISRPTVREAIIALELDELVEVRLGSGVYVKSRNPPPGPAAAKDIGPFELLEARRAIEGEVCAVAASRITDEEIGKLDELLGEMRADNRQNEIVMSEDADRRFHELIAIATQNSALYTAMKMLWDTRSRSPQTHLMDDRVRARGMKPSIAEHAAIVRALKRRDPDAARAAMHKHLTRVLEGLLERTEVREIQKARETAAQKRRMYSATR